jgi:hypothetical protein
MSSMITPLQCLREIQVHIARGETRWSLETPRLEIVLKVESKQGDRLHRTEYLVLNNYIGRHI